MLSEDKKASIDDIKNILKYFAKGYKVPNIITETIRKVAKLEIEDKKRVVLTKRDPNVERGRIQGNYVKIIEGETIEIHPSVVGGYGADFDGDSCFSDIYYFNNNFVKNKLHISKFDKDVSIELESEKTKDNGVVIKNYKVLDEVYADSICVDDADIKFNKITHWSIHENLKMFKINRKPRITQCSNVLSMWVSDNHSLVVYDINERIVKKATPEEILEDKNNYCFIKNKKTNNKNNSPFILMPEFNVFDKPIDIDFGYMIGAWIGDGYLSQSNFSEKKNDKSSFIGFTNSNDDISLKFSNVLENFSNNKITILEDRKSMYPNPYDIKKVDGSDSKIAKRTKVIDVKIGTAIKKYFGKGAGGKHLPGNICNFTEEFLIGLMAGYLDTDGTISKDYYTVQSKSEDLIKDIYYMLKTKFDIDSSVYNEIKKYLLGESGTKIDVTNEPDKWRSYWTLNIKINGSNKDFFEKVYENILEPTKRETLRKVLDNCKEARYVGVTVVPYEIVQHLTMKERKDYLDFTNDNTIKIKANGYTQKKVIIPDHLIENSMLPESCKQLLYKQNIGEIEFIPCEYLDIEYDPEVTTGYDFTVEDYLTFTTAENIFVFDTMSVFTPISLEAQNEVKEKMITTDSFERINAPNFTLSKEMNIGLFTLTFLEDTKSIPKLINSVDEAKKLNIATLVKYNSNTGLIITTAGRVVFNSVLPPYIPFINKPMNSKDVNGVLAVIIAKNKGDFARVVDAYCKMGFEYATSYPQTISLDMFIVPENLKKLSLQLGQEKLVEKQVEILAEMEIKLKEHLKNNVPGLYIQIESGAAKGGSQLRQIMIAKGLINNAAGELLPPIAKSLNDGYTPEEYFEAAAGSRKGIIDRAVNTAYGGYAYRKMVYAVGSTEGNIENADCGTKKGISIKLTKELWSRMSGRYMINDKRKVERLTEEHIGKIVEVRSPIYCKSRKICRTCYGDLIYQIKSRNVGLLAAQACASLSEKIMKCSTGFVECEDGTLISLDILWDRIP